MPGAACAPCATSPLGLPAARRLRQPSQFTAVLQAARADSVRASGALLALTAAWTTAPSAGRPASARFGFTVGKRLARRSVDRNAVRRVLREASRHAAPALDAQAATHGRMLDLNFRLKAPWLAAPEAAATGFGARKKALRTEADHLLASVALRLKAPVSAPAPDAMPAAGASGTPPCA